MPATSLRLRIMLWIWGLLLVIFIPMYIFLPHSVRTELVSHGQERALKMLDAACWTFSQQPFPAGEQDIRTWLADLGGRLGVRMTYTLDGRVAADSHVSDVRLAQVEDHSMRPEIIQAVSGRVGMDIRHSATIGRDLIYVARKCPVDGVGERDAVLRLALPMSNLYEQVDILKKRFFLILGACLLLSLFLSFWFSKGLLTSIKKLVQLVSDVGAGAYDRRLYVPRTSEFFPLTEAVNSMAQAISGHINVVQEQKTRLEALFNGLSEAVIAVGRDGRIISVNPAFRRFFPKMKSIEGKTLLEATLEPDLAAAMERTLRDGPEQSERLLLQRPGGAELEARINTYRDPSGNLQAVVVIQDVSLPRRMEKIRRDFVANVSHEMRTPLTSIKGYTETLLGEVPPDPETARSFLRIIHRNAEHMAAMVTDLLKLAKLEAEAPAETLETIAAGRSLEMALEICMPMAEDKAIQYVNHLEGCSGIMVLGDTSRVAQVFQNILENAIRHSPKRGTVTVTCAPEGEFLVFGVRDQGPGIPRDHQERLFERFYRQDSARGEANGGTGLGLAICKHIIRHHGGRIWVESTPGDGATFFFTLKVARQGAKASC